ncbi:MAG: Flp family type IVb pilin [Peptococcaceae bacterium]|nr:Flp family type IVb pilin [Peptococcaceae bacterium]
MIKRFYIEESGQGLTEYSLILAFVALVLIGALSQVVQGIMGAYQRAANLFSD